MKITLNVLSILAIIGIFVTLYFTNFNSGLMIHTISSTFVFAILFIVNLTIVPKGEKLSVTVAILEIVFMLLIIVYFSYYSVGTFKKIEDEERQKHEEYMRLTKIELYWNGSYVLLYNSIEKRVTIEKRDEKKDGEIISYNYSMTRLSETEEEDLKKSFHATIKIKSDYASEIIGMYEKTMDDISPVDVYIVSENGTYKLEGNGIILQKVFSNVLEKNSIFVNKIAQVNGSITDTLQSKSESVILEEYYTDDEFNYIFNGEKLYDNIYKFDDYSEKDAVQRISEYMKFLGDDKDKQIKNFIQKTIPIDNEYVVAINLYYYNNLQTISYVEFVLKDKKHSIIICKSDSRFAFENITKPENSTTLGQKENNVN